MLLIALLLAMLGLGATGQRLEAQNGRLIYTHSPKTKGSIAPLSYLAPNGTTADVSSGTTFDISQGAQLCLEVRDANPLLYAYTVKAETLAVKAPDELQTFITAFKTLLPGSLQGATDWKQYTGNLATIVDNLSTIADAKWVSDTLGFVSQYGAVTKAGDIAKLKLQGAKTLRNDHEKEWKNDSAIGKEKVELYVLAQESLERQLNAALKEWEDAHSQVDAQGSLWRCVGLGTVNIRVGYYVKASAPFPKGHEPQRFEGTIIDNIEVDPRGGQLYALSTGAVFGLFNDVPTYSVQSGLVQSGAEDRHPLRPAALLMVRPTTRFPVWLTLGAGTGAENIKNPDLFIGAVLRVAGDVNHPLITIGGGAITSAFKSRLPAGVQIGQPLPTSITKLDDAVTTEYRWGLGLIFTVYGVDFTKSGSDQKAGKDAATSAKSSTTK